MICVSNRRRVTRLLLDMNEISRVNLYSKLNPLAYKTLDSASIHCKLRGNPRVELVHWVQQILDTSDSDWHRIVRWFEIDLSRLAKDLTSAVDRLPGGANSIANFSSNVDQVV